MKSKLTFFARLTFIFSLPIIISSCSKTPVNPNTTPGNLQNYNGTVTTLAGKVTAGVKNGQDTAARFFFPSGVVVNASGNIIVADGGNNLIRQITPTGLATTIAGIPNGGSSNGTGVAASFHRPYAVAVDASGNIYVADQNNNLIRKITSAGVVITLAGSGSAGAANGVGTAASFFDPSGIAVDASGNVYVADQGNNQIRKITPAGVVSTFAGSGQQGSANGTGTAATFNYPAGLAVDASGNIFVADEFNNQIREITPAGVVTTVAGTGASGSANGAAASSTFNYPTGVAVDAAGNLYIADSSNNLIRKILSGVVSTLAGTGAAGADNGAFATCSFNEPTGIAVDATGIIYVADNNNNQIRKLKP